MNERIQVVKIDSDKYPNLASQYQVQALPTLILFQNGQPVNRLEGAMQAPQLMDWIDNSLAKAAV